MTPLERANCIIQGYGIMGSNATAIRDAIHRAIIEATNSEVERRRQAERELEQVVSSIEEHLSGFHHLASVMERVKCKLKRNPTL